MSDLAVKGGLGMSMCSRALYSKGWWHGGWSARHATTVTEMRTHTQTHVARWAFKHKQT